MVCPVFHHSQSTREEASTNWPTNYLPWQTYHPGGACRALNTSEGSAAMKHAVRLVNRLLGGLTVVVFTILIICVVWQVVSRFILGTPSTTTDEIARFLFMWIAFVGAAYTLGQNRHLAIDVISLMVEDKTQRRIRMLVLVIVAAFAAIVMVYGGFELMMKTLASGQVTPALRLPMGYVYGAIPFSGLMMLFYCAALFSELLHPETPSDDEAASDDSSAPEAPQS